MANYETVETGIRLYHGKEDSYNVELELPPRNGRKERTYTFHVGSFPTLEKARLAKAEAENICNKTAGDEQTAALLELKEKYKKVRKICCGKKVMRAWKYCPFCGKTI